MDIATVLVTAMHVHKVIFPTIFTANKTKGTSLYLILHCDKHQEEEANVLKTCRCLAITYNTFLRLFTGARLLPSSMGVQALSKNYVFIQWVFLCAVA